VAAHSGFLRNTKNIFKVEGLYSSVYDHIVFMLIVNKSLSYC